MAYSAILTNLWARRDDQPVDRLLKLYSDRAGVKRELKEMRLERYELLDKLKEHEDANSRAQEQLEGLERLLTDPLTAANVMVYFQLRHLWRVGAQKLQQFGDDLKAQREERERARLHEGALAKRGRRMGAVNDKLDSVVRKQQKLIPEINAIQERLTSMNGLLRLFRGPSMRRQIGRMNNGKEALQRKIDELKELGERIQSEVLPEIDGLSVQSRRLINCAVIALAQHLVVHFSERDLVGLTKTATECPVGDMNFGDRGECDRMVEHIRERIEDLRQQTKLTDDVRRRTDYLIKQVKYGNETNCLPTLESIATVPQIIPSAEGGPTQDAYDRPPLKINVLLDEYWDIATFLC